MARDKATFCLTTGVAPSEYDRMTLRELKAFEDIYLERLETLREEAAQRRIQ